MVVLRSIRHTYYIVTHVMVRDKLTIRVMDSRGKSFTVELMPAIKAGRIPKCNCPRRKSNINK